MKSANTTRSLLLVAAVVELALAARDDVRSSNAAAGQTWASNSSAVEVPSVASSLITTPLPASSSGWAGNGFLEATSEGLGGFEPQRLVSDLSSSALSGTGDEFSDGVSLAPTSFYPTVLGLSTLESSPRSSSPPTSSLPSSSSPPPSTGSSTESRPDSTSTDSVPTISAIDSGAKSPASSTMIITHPPPSPSHTFITLTTLEVPIPSVDDTEDPFLDCIPPNKEQQHTTISIVYTATTTFFGNPTDYVPPYPELTTPNLCPYPANPEFGAGPGGEDISGNHVTTVCHAEKGRKTCKTLTIEVPTNQKPKPTELIEEIVTFVTTDKNPSVVFSPIKTPSFGKGTYDGNDGPQQTKIPAPQTKLPQSSPTTQRPDSTHQLTIEPTKVIIDSRTITVHPTQTTQVRVGDQLFTINPSEIVGEGNTVRRPWNGQVGGGTVQPSTTTVDSTRVIIAPSGSRSVVAIGDKTFTIPSGGTTAVVDGATVTLSPTAIHLPGHVVPINNEAPRLTEVFIEGGQMITAIGPTLLVIDGTTITYGKKTPPTIRMIDDEVITIGPSGVVVGSNTLGGPKAAQQDTDMRIVGGATITQIGESILVIDGTTFTVGPNGDGPLTTSMGGEKITIGPDGVSFSTISLAYPFGPTVVTTMVVSPTKTEAMLPAETGEDEDNEGNAMRCSPLTIILFCIAVGVWNLGHV